MRHLYDSGDASSKDEVFELPNKRARNGERVTLGKECFMFSPKIAQAYVNCQSYFCALCTANITIVMGCLSDCYCQRPGWVSYHALFLLDCTIDLLVLRDKFLVLHFMTLFWCV